MSLRTVFGRRKVEFEGRQFTIEMRPDGIYVRRKYAKDSWKLPFEVLLNHAKNQPELVWDNKDQPEMFEQPDPSDKPLPELQHNYETEKETTQPNDTRPRSEREGIADLPQLEVDAPAVQSPEEHQL